MTKVANPAALECCNEYQCQPIASEAVGVDSTQLQSLDSNTADNSVPGYAIALLVIGILIVLVLIAVSALLNQQLHS